MNNLNDARAWEIVRRLAEFDTTKDLGYTAQEALKLGDDARELLAQVSELEEAKRMIAHLQSIRLGLLGALKLCSDRLEEYPDAIGGVALECARKSLEAAQAGKIPPTTQEAA